MIKRLTARFVAGIMLAMAVLVPTAVAANANPPKTNNCYSSYRDGVINVSRYQYYSQTLSTCKYRKWTWNTLNGYGEYYVGIITVSKKSTYV